MADREDVIFAIEHCLLSDSTICEGCYQNGPGLLGIECRRGVCHDALKLLKEQPEQKHGHWIIHGEPPIMVKTCSACGIRIFHHSGGELEKFCAWCGTKMDEEVTQDA